MSGPNSNRQPEIRNPPAAQVPRGEGEQVLRTIVTPWLEGARRTRTVSLHVGLVGATAIDQRSCLVAPLIAKCEFLGCLYCDIEGAVSRFGQVGVEVIESVARQPNGMVLMDVHMPEMGRLKAMRRPSREPARLAHGRGAGAPYSFTARRCR